MNIISFTDMPIANGHLTLCNEHNEILYISGQPPFIPRFMTMPEGIEAQTLKT